MDKPPAPQLIFHCPSCNTRLAVEASCAGISGPCPRCHCEITAPLATPPEEPAVTPPVATKRTAGLTSKALLAIGILTISGAITLFILNRRDLLARYGQADPAASEPPVTQAEHRSTPAPVNPPTTSTPPPQPVPERHEETAELTPAQTVLPLPPVEPIKLSDEETLIRFLDASSLAERLPLMNHAPDDVTVLAKPLPPRVSISTAYRIVNRQADTTDQFYSVEFQGQRSQLMLVRQKGGEAPRVATAPVLDLLGGRLAAFAADPSQSTASFHVLASAIPRCTNAAIPDASKKITIHLLADEAGKAIATAYAAKDSALGKLLESAAAEFRYGQPTVCVIELRWNRAENPRQPYLEATAIKEFGW